jgi:hypothetical protein
MVTNTIWHNIGDKKEYRKNHQEWLPNFMKIIDIKQILILD